MWQKSIYVLYLLLLLIPQTAAQTLTELNATPPVLTEPGSYFLIKEINFKNKTADWVKMQYYSPGGNTFNINGLSFADDNIFKTLEQNIFIESGQEILLTFKNGSPDSIPYIYTQRSGLTGTTEQFIVYGNDSRILDAVCWTSESPTEKEISDLELLYENEGWHSPDIFSCFQSGDLKNDESLIRLPTGDTDSASDWISQTSLAQAENSLNQNDITASADTSENTPEENTDNTLSLTVIDSTNQITLSATDTDSLVSPEIDSIHSVAPFTNLDNSRTTRLQNNPEKESVTKTNSGKTEKIYSDGDLSGDITLSEIMPNPDGSDTKKEWIEIFNNSDSEINLGNWTLDDADGGSKEYVIPDSASIKSGETLLFNSDTTKLSLANGEDQVRLFDHAGNLIDAIEYESAPSGQSFSRVRIINDNNEETFDLIWTQTPSPGQPNTVLYEKTIEIKQEPMFESAYFFLATDSLGTVLTVSFSEDIIAAPLAKAGFTQGTKIKTLLEPALENPGNFILKKYEILAGPAPSKNPSLLIPGIAGLITAIGGGAFYLFHKRIPWQDITGIKKQTS